MPERYLHQFFKTLPIDYQAHEIDTAESLKDAVDELDELENLPLVYEEEIPRRELHLLLFVIALLCSTGLTLIKFLEIEA